MAIFESVKDSVRGAFKPQPRGFSGFARGAVKGYNAGFKGNLPFFIAFGSYAAATAPRGQKVSKVAGSGVGFGVTAVIAGAIGGAFGIPPTISAMVAGFLLGDKLDNAISSGVQSFVDFGSKQRKMNMGGDYRDTQVAYTMRQVAAREMGTSLMNARQWLGGEAAFLHQ